MAATQVKPAIILDTGVISRIIKGQPAFITAFEEVEKSRVIYITFVTRLELYEWLRGNRRAAGERAYQVALRAVESFELLPHSAAVTRQALALGQHVPHVGVADYVNAAAALVAKCPLFTLNRKHFRRTNVKLYEPPGFNFARESS